MLAGSNRVKWGVNFISTVSDTKSYFQLPFRKKKSFSDRNTNHTDHGKMVNISVGIEIAILGLKLFVG